MVSRMKHGVFTCLFAHRKLKFREEIEGLWTRIDSPTSINFCAWKSHTTVVVVDYVLDGENLPSIRGIYFISKFSDAVEKRALSSVIYGVTLSIN
jgi:hypothetical protein